MSPTNKKPTMESLLEIVRQLEPVIRTYAPEAERERRLSDPVAEAMLENGLYWMWRPKAFGGLEVDPVTALRVSRRSHALTAPLGGTFSSRVPLIPSVRGFLMKGHGRFSAIRRQCWAARSFRPAGPCLLMGATD